MRRAVLVADLGFGDAGKGLVVDYLVRELRAHTVIRFNGGAQAGHNVVTIDGRHHTFSQFGSGTFVRGARTHLSRHVVVHPTALLVEAERLGALGISDALARLSVSSDARVVTPFHQAAGRLRELGRADAGHGTCGVGVGEVMQDAQVDGLETVRVRDLCKGRALSATLRRIQERKRVELTDTVRSLAGDPRAVLECRVLEDSAITDRWLEQLAVVVPRIELADDADLGERLQQDGAVVFEGAHGVLIDEWCGFHPYTTWSTCTFENAVELLREHGYTGQVTRLGVLRTYACRHGPGPLPTQHDELVRYLPEPHNLSDSWQGAFRVGWPDALLWRYACDACGGVDGLALTHLDRHSVLPEWRVCRAYELPACSMRGLFEADPNHANRASRVLAPVTRDLHRQAELTLALTAAKACYESMRGASDAAAFARFVESELDVPVVLQSFGPTAGAVQRRQPIH